MATSADTFAYKERHGDSFARTYFRLCGNLAVSSIGAGTYLGDPTDEVDDAYFESLTTAFESGMNVVDTAINYRHQRSERVVGRAVEAADVDRSSLFVSTKGGFVPFDERRPDNPGEFVREQYVDTGLVDPADLARGSHCIAPEYIDDQLDRSLANLGLDTIDLYYVHNPETQLHARSREVVYDQLERTFERLEERAAAGDLNYYGVATWDAFRVPKDDDRYLSLSEVISRARNAAKTVGNAATHLRAIQLPFNVFMADAFTVKSHDGPDGPRSALWFAQEAGLNVFTSASLSQGQLTEEIPADVSEKLQGDTVAQRALNFARSAPGVTCSLAGTTSREHIAENVAAGTYEPLGADAFDAIFE